MSRDVIWKTVLYREGRDDTLAALAKALNITDPEWATEAAPDAVTWKRATDAQRLIYIGDILRSYCFNLIDSQINATVSTDRIPMNTVGTND